MRILKPSTMNCNNKIIPEIKEDHDNELTKEEIDLIGSHLDKEIEDLNQHIEQ